MKQNKECEAQFFDEFVSEGEDYDVLSEAAYRRIASVFTRLVQPQAGQTLIDLGCGTGAFTRAFNLKGLQVTGMDISPLSIERACELSDAETYVVGDILNTGLEDNHFDVVAYSGVLHHFPEFSDVLKEGYRILKPGGHLFSVDPNLGNPCMWLYRSPSSPLYSSKGVTPNERLFTAATLRTQLNDAGFEQVNTFGMSGITYTFVESRLIRLLLPLYNLFEILLGVSPFARRYGSFLIGHASKGGGR